MIWRNINGNHDLNKQNWYPRTRIFFAEEQKKNTQILFAIKNGLFKNFGPGKKIGIIPKEIHRKWVSSYICVCLLKCDLVERFFVSRFLVQSTITMWFGIFSVRNVVCIIKLIHDFRVDPSILSYFLGIKKTFFKLPSCFKLPSRTSPHQSSVDNVVFLLCNNFGSGNSRFDGHFSGTSIWWCL